MSFYNFENKHDKYLRQQSWTKYGVTAVLKCYKIPKDYD